MTDADQKNAFRNDPPFTRRMGLLGFAIIGFFVFAFGAWSKMAPIQSAVLAPGIVSVESGIQNVQHLEGGIVQDILTGAGEEVQAGEVLIRLQSTEPFARLNDVQARYFEALATQARLTAERDGLSSIDFPEYLKRKIGDQAAQSAMANQRAIFEGRQQLLTERLTILRKTEDGLRSEIEGLTGQIVSSERKLEIVQEELETATDLWERGLAKRSRVLALEREKAGLTGEMSQYRAAIGSADQRLAEASLRIAELKSLSTTEIAEDLRAIGAEAYQLNQQIAAAQDIVTRTEIRSPIDGIVVDMNVKTIGGVISAGEALVSILPRDDELVVQSTIDPLDIDRVSEGLEATVWLTSLNRRNHSGITGTVQTISADRINDPQTGTSYYLARVVMNPSDVERSSIPLQPGMGAEVMIRTGEQTAFDYLTAPIARSFSRAFREN